MKKLLTVLLTVLMCFSLAACSKSDDGSSDGEAKTGKVYYLNFKPEADEAWQESCRN